MCKKMVKFAIVLTAFVFTGCTAIAQQQGKINLENDKLKVEFDKSGLTSIQDAALNKTISLTNDGFSLSFDGTAVNSADIQPQVVKESASMVIYTFKKDGHTIKVVYELQKGWRFVSKQIMIEPAALNDYTVKQITVFNGKVVGDIQETYKLSGGRYGISLRMKNNPADEKAGFGCFMLIQNPMSRYEEADKNITAAYDPNMQWKSQYGPFASDRFCIGTFKISGNSFRSDMAGEWAYVQNPDQFLAEGSQIDYCEIEAVTNCARAFVIQDREKSVRVHIGWCENDYQIDTATEQGRTEYRRIIDQAASFGCQYVLYTPHNSEIAPLSENRDAWGWESLLWFNMGQKIRKGEWTPGKDKLPATVQGMIDYAKNKNLKLMAYAYPTVPFMQNPEWTDWLTKRNQGVGGYAGPDTGVRSFQDWLVDKLVDFVKATGCGGYSFDHWWMAYDDASSRYQQWYGTRRILETLRKRLPDVIIDGRQQYHGFGTWTWLAGTYPHPMMSDEQPGSFRAIVDLSTDRVNGARQRYVAWRLMTRDFCPTEILPGFITHQTQRGDANNVMRRDEYRTRDWDYLGWKYSLISSIATAPFNHVVNYLPARDIQEYKLFPDKDKKFFRDWLDFTDKNAKYMKKVRPIIGQPMIGRCDGTSAIIEDNGFLFLFNPNYRKMNAEFKLDASIGLTKGESFTIKELFPQENKYIGSPQNGLFKYADNVSIPMDGTSAVVLQIEPVKSVSRPILFNSTGKADIASSALVLSDVTGQFGEEKELLVLLPDEKAIKEVTVNGKKIDFIQKGKAVSCKVKFAGQYFPISHQIGKYNPQFDANTVEGKFTIPSRIFKQLSENKKAWPVNYTKDDLVAPWIDPSRLLLFVQIADPYISKEVAERREGREGRARRNAPIGKEDVKIEIDGKQVEVKEGYNGVYPYVSGSFMGIYAELTDLKSDIEHTIKVTLPDGLKSGQFQGLFFDHVQNEYTAELASK